MLKRLICGALLAAMAGLAACNSAPGLSPEDDAALRRPFEQLQRGEVDQLMAQIGPELRNQPDIQQRLRAVRAIVPQRAPVSVRLVNWNKTFATGQGSTLTGVHDYDFGAGHILVTTTLSRQEGKAPVYTGFFVQPVTAAQAEGSRFTLAGKSPIHYVFLLLTIAAPLVTVAALIKLFRTKPKVRRRWLWTIAILIGLPTLNLNWATGAIGVQLSFLLFSAAVMKSAAAGAPWVLSVSAPIAAIVFLFRKPPAPSETAEKLA